MEVALETTRLAKVATFIMTCMCVAILDNVRMCLHSFRFPREIVVSSSYHWRPPLPFACRRLSPCIPRMVHVFNALAGRRLRLSRTRIGLSWQCHATFKLCIIDRTITNPHKYINQGMQQLSRRQANGNGGTNVKMIDDASDFPRIQEECRHIHTL